MLSHRNIDAFDLLCHASSPVVYHLYHSLGVYFRSILIIPFTGWTYAPPPFVTKENCVIGKCAFSLAYCACKGLSEALCFGWLILRRQYLTFPWIIQEIFSSPILELIIHSLSHYLHFFWISVVTGLIVATNLMHHIRIRYDVTFSSYCMSGIYGLNYVVAR